MAISRRATLDERIASSQQTTRRTQVPVPLMAAKVASAVAVPVPYRET